MDENTTRLVEQLKNNPAALQALMRSQDGQALLRMLTQGDQGAGLQRAAKAAALGRPEAMVNMVNRIMQTPGGAALVERINQAVRK